MPRESAFRRLVVFDNEHGDPWEGRQGAVHVIISPLRWADSSKRALTLKSGGSVMTVLWVIAIFGVAVGVFYWLAP